MLCREQPSAIDSAPTPRPDSAAGGVLLTSFVRALKILNIHTHTTPRPLYVSTSQFSISRSILPAKPLFNLYFSLPPLSLPLFLGPF